MFIAHGHDRAARESVRAFIQKLGLNAIILQEQPNAGRTLIEKLEYNSQTVYAVVIMTPHDISGLAELKTWSLLWEFRFEIQSD